MDPLMDVLKNYEEPEWLERKIVGEIRLWQIMFLCMACMTTLSEYLRDSIRSNLQLQRPM